MVAQLSVMIPVSSRDALRNTCRPSAGKFFNSWHYAVTKTFTKFQLVVTANRCTHLFDGYSHFHRTICLFFCETQSPVTAWGLTTDSCQTSRVSCMKGAWTTGNWSPPWTPRKRQNVIIKWQTYSVRKAGNAGEQSALQANFDVYC